MSLLTRGETTSTLEVTNVSQHGFWLFVDDSEYFLPFDQNPWFKDAPISAVFNVERPSPQHFHWPDLDVDLELDAIRYPERFPLIAKYDSRQSNKKK